MRRSLGLLLALLVTVCGLAVAAAPPGQAADPLTGRLVSTDGGGGVAGQTVRLRRLADGGAPGAVVATDTTDAEGRFSLDAGEPTQDEYYVQVGPGSHQGGYVGGSPRSSSPAPTTPRPGDRTTSSARCAPTPASSAACWSTRRPSGRSAGSGSRGAPRAEKAADTDVTDRAGEVRRIATCRARTTASCASAVARAATRTATAPATAGWSPTWGDACASPLGRVGRVRIQRL